jgi:hypothetical protein
LKSASAIIISRIFHLPVLLFTILAAKLSVSRIVAHRSLQLSPQIRAMAPSDVQSQRPAASESMEMTNSQPVLADQPKRQQEMDPQRPHADTELSLRGGNDGRGMCPGRFCFIIPCPLPCNCCIFPCPF